MARWLANTHICIRNFANPAPLAPTWLLPYVSGYGSAVMRIYQNVEALAPNGHLARNPRHQVLSRTWQAHPSKQPSLFCLMSYESVTKISSTSVVPSRLYSVFGISNSRIIRLTTIFPILCCFLKFSITWRLWMQTTCMNTSGRYCCSLSNIRIDQLFHPSSFLQVAGE